MDLLQSSTDSNPWAIFERCCNFLKSSTEEQVAIAENLTEIAQDVVKTFGKLFLINSGATILEEVIEEVKKKNNEKKVEWRLTKKESKSEKSDKLFKGELFMREGGGAGDFSKWKKVYVVEHKDGDIEIYENEKSVAAKKPLVVIHPAGYKLITNVKQHYKSEIMGYVNELREVDADQLTADMEDFTWALAHPDRQNYMFLARENKLKSSSGCCFKGQVEPQTPSETNEERDARRKAQDFMSACIDNAEPRDKTTTEGKAFDMTIRQLPQELDELDNNWTDDGSETEILVDILMEVGLPSTRNKILNETKGPVSIKLKSWYKTKKVTYDMMLKIVDKAWKEIMAAFKKLRETVVEPIIKPGLEPIVELRAKIQQKVQENVTDKLGNLLGEVISPVVKPIVDLYAYPLNESLDAGRKLVEEKLNPTNIPEGQDKRDDYLEKLERRRFDSRVLYQTLNEIDQRLDQLRSLSPRIISGFRLNRMKTEIQQAVDEIMVAAAYTFKIRMTETSATIEELYVQILKDFDHDAKIVKAEFLQNSVNRFLQEAFHKISDPTLKPLVSKLDENIPESLQPVVSVQKVLDEVIDRLVLQPIEIAVTQSYPLPTD